MMRIGSQHGIFTLRRRVQLGVNEVNEPNFVWQDWRDSIFAEVEVRRGKEVFDTVGKKRMSEDVWRFRTRYDEVHGIDATMKIFHEGNLFDIKAILPDGQRHVDCVIEATVQDGALGGKPLTVAITMLISEGAVGQVYEGFTISASGGTGPYVFSTAEGAMAPGLVLDGDTGAVSGTPAAAGAFAIVVTITDADGTVEVLPSFNILVEEA